MVKMSSTTVSLHGSPKKSTKNAVSQTVLEYGEACSLHGIQYVFERRQNLLASRLFWLLMVSAGIAIGIYWSVEVSEIKQEVYRDRLKGVQILLSRAQAEPGRTAKQEQEEISRNHVQPF